MEKRNRSLYYILQMILGIGIALILGNGICFIQAKAEEVIICEANGSDQEDDTQAIQAALDAAKGKGGAVVQIPAGRYYISRTLTIYSNTTLRLDPSAEIIRTDGSNIMIRSEQDYNIGGYGQASNIVIDGGVWNGNVTDSTILCPLMYFAHAQNITLQNFSVKSVCSRHMVILAGIDTAVISNVSFSDFVLFTGEDVNGEYYVSDGVSGEINKELAMRTMEALHLDCISADGMSEALAYPLDGTANSNIVVENCTFNGLMSGVGNHYSFDPNLKGAGLTIRNNTFLNMKYTCINIYSQGGISVTGNQADNVGELLRAVGSSGTISGNTVVCSGAVAGSEMDLCGIKITDSLNMQIDNNNITGGVHGISADNTGGNINDNIIAGSMVNGISILSGSDVTVKANTIKEAAENSIYVGDSAVSVLSNTLTESGGNALAIYESRNVSVKDNKIDGGENGCLFNHTSGEAGSNTISNTRVSGIWILEGADIAAADNTITGAGSHGIHMYGAVGELRGNKISESKEEGIYLYSVQGTAAGKVNVTGNEVRTLGDCGIQIEESSYIVADNNKVLNAPGNGISILNSTEVTAEANNIDGAANVGIYVNGSAISVLSNTLTAGKGNALAVYDSRKVLVQENGIEGGENGCLFNNASGEAVSNTIANTTARGMWMLNGADIKAADNTITYAGSHGIHMNGAVGELRGNRITGSKEKGIYLYNVQGTAVGRVNVAGNDVQTSGDRGIQLEASTCITVDNNTVNSSAQQGIRVISGCSKISVINNNVTQNKQHGIIVDSSKEINIDYNTVTGNGTKEISVLNGSTGSASHNTVGELGVYTYDLAKFPVSSDSGLSGLVKVQNQWCYMNNGVIDRSFEGMARNDYGWWYVKNGTIDWTYTGMARNQYGWWYITKGKLDNKYTGMAKNAYGWWYMKNGKLDTTYTGMAKNAYGWWYISKGKLDNKYTGMAKNAYGWWYMKNGKLDTTYTGMAKNAYGWWYIKNGKLDTTFTGIAENSYGKWYMKNGQIQLNYTGDIKIDGITYTVVKGKVTGSHT